MHYTHELIANLLHPHRTTIATRIGPGHWRLGAYSHPKYKATRHTFDNLLL